MRNFKIRDVRLVGGVEEQKHVMFMRVSDPARELCARCDGTRWVVWKTKIDEIHRLLRRFRYKIVFRRTWQIINALVAAILSYRARVARHNVCVYVHRIDWIRNRDFVLAAENIKDVTAIVF